MSSAVAPVALLFTNLVNSAELLQQPGDQRAHPPLACVRLLGGCTRPTHRNAILGRESTREEIDSLNQPGSPF
jgi:hypothetical protein